MRLLQAFYIVVMITFSILLIYMNYTVSPPTLESSAKTDVQMATKYYENQVSDSSIYVTEELHTPTTQTPLPTEIKGEKRGPIRISLITVLTNNTDISNYTRAIDSMKCYAKIHGYKFIIAHDEDYADRCTQNDKFFRRHCIVAIEAQLTDYTVMIDADNGVVNPKRWRPIKKKKIKDFRKLEEFIDDRFDITFYDRFFNAEVAMGSYILKNSQAGIDFIKEFSNYETKLPNSCHGSDNGAIHAFLIFKIFPDREDEYKICLEKWNNSVNYDLMFAYESCIRSMIGIGETHGNIRIYRKGTAWVRDNWLTNSMWSPESDFMIHGWKEKELVKYNSTHMPIKMTISNRYTWYDPLVGLFNLEQCKPGNTTWKYDRNLITSAAEVKQQLKKLHRTYQRDSFAYLGMMADAVVISPKYHLFVIVFLLIN